MWSSITRKGRHLIPVGWDDVFCWNLACAALRPPCASWRGLAPPCATRFVFVARVLCSCACHFSRCPDRMSFGWGCESTIFRFLSNPPLPSRVRRHSLRRLARACATLAPVGAGLRHPCATKFDPVARVLCLCAGLASLSRFPDRTKNGWESPILNRKD